MTSAFGALYEQHMNEYYRMNELAMEELRLFSADKNTAHWKRYMKYSQESHKHLAIASRISTRHINRLHMMNTGKKLFT